MKLCINFHISISRIDGTRDDQTSACFRDSFGNLISVSVFKRTIINVSLAKNLTETLDVSSIRYPRVTPHADKHSTQPKGATWTKTGAICT